MVFVGHPMCGCNQESVNGLGIPTVGHPTIRSSICFATAPLRWDSEGRCSGRSHREPPHETCRESFCGIDWGLRAGGGFTQECFSFESRLKRKARR